MDRPRMRPTFSVRLTPEPEAAMETIREKLRRGEYEECSRSKGRCADFFVPEDERRLWSPYLSVQVEPQGTGSLLRGRFGPHPELWTLYMFSYTAVGFLTIMGLLLGFVQLQSGMDPWGLWGAGIGIPCLAILFAVSATGQRLSAHQMEDLKARIDLLVAGMEEGRGGRESDLEALEGEATNSRGGPGQSPST